MPARCSQLTGADLLTRVARCFDCDSIKMFCDPQEANGNCSAYRGTGFSEFLDLPSCEECYSTDICPTSSGSGVLEQEEIGLAA